MNTAASIGEILDYCLGKRWRTPGIPDFLRWPPDAFAVAATLLFQSGAYVHVVKTWPPKIKGARDSDRWIKTIKKIAAKWRVSAATGDDLGSDPPPEVVEWWEALKGQAHVALADCRTNPELCDILLQLLAVADEASTGAGLPAYYQSRTVDEFLQKVLLHLATALPGKPDGDPQPSTLCKTIHPSRLIVLPKARTPQSGITIRSLSHHLAVIFPCGIRPMWQHVRLDRDADSEHSINVLLLPWPKQVIPTQFQPVKTAALGAARDMLVGNHGFFQFVPEKLNDLVSQISNLYREAKRVVGRIDGVIFPEMAMGAEDFDTVVATLESLNHDGFTISGLYRPPGTNGEPADNYAAIAFSSLKQASYRSYSFDYHKHHRWFLEENQICRYGLGSQLDPMKKWWEYTSLKPRSLHFVALCPWLTFTVLICEDLARPDPAADLIRSVGPNLVIALLQDGPQLARRWPARAATVLADDPGCSVLTLTGLGMTQLGLPPPGKSQSRAVAMWREVGNPDIQEIELPSTADGIVLSLSRRRQKQWTADGRDDGETTGDVRLAGGHMIRAASPPDAKTRPKNSAFGSGA